jgi:hypothetical protein
MRLSTPQPGGPDPRTYIPEEQDGPVIPPGTGFPCRLLRLAGLRWRYYNPPQHGGWHWSWSSVTTDGQSISQYLLMSRAHCGAPSLTRGRVCLLSVTVSSNSKKFEVTLRLTVSQSVCLCIEHPLGLTSYRYVSVWNLRSYFCGAPSLVRGPVCNLQCNHSMVRIAQNP